LNELNELQLISRFFAASADSLYEKGPDSCPKGRGNGKAHMHVFSPGRNPFTDNFREVDDKVELVALPTAIYDAFRYKGMIKRRLFHPVLNLQSIDMTEMFHVTCYDNEVFLKCSGPCLNSLAISKGSRSPPQSE